MEGRESMRAFRWGAVLAGGLIVAVPMTAKAAVTGSSVPAVHSPSSGAPRSAAPAGTAEAYAAQVGNILGISHTASSASGSGTSSKANALEVGGQPLSSQFGGSQAGPGSNSGALIDTGPSTQFRLQVTPWSAANTETGSQKTASAVSDILSLDLGDPSTTQSASIRVLQSQSSSSWTSAASSSTASSDGATVALGGPSGLSLDLLHSGTSSAGGSNSYLASINGNQIGSSSQVNGACSLTLPSLLSLNCLTAGAGNGGSVTDQVASVLSATLGSGSSGLPINALTATSSSGSGTASPGGGSGGTGSGGGTTTPSPNPTAQPAATSPANSVTPNALAAVASSAGSHNLAFTGLNLVALLALALLLGVSGALAVLSARHHRIATS
jgi:hypothetical protein